MADRVGLVLAGGSARGAYETGALSVLLPELERLGQRPTVLLGTSIGGLHAAYLATRADVPADRVMDDALRMWREIESIPPKRIGRKAFRYFRGLYGFGRARVFRLLDTESFAAQVGGVLDLPIKPPALAALDAVGVAATSVSTSRSVVFVEGGDPPAPDLARGIDYVGTTLTNSHVLASAAIPIVFPAVHVDDPVPWNELGDWYVDGGTRLNAPIKPAVELDVDRLVIIALNSAPQDPVPTRPSTDRPDIADALVQLLQAGLVDQLVQDVQTLRKRNQGQGPKVIPYIFIAPGPYEIGAVAKRVYDDHYARKHFDQLAVLGRLTGTERTAVHGEILSSMFFSRDFTGELIALGEQHARDWIAGRQGRPDYPWDR
jgi:NTE family protein